MKATLKIYPPPLLAVNAERVRAPRHGEARTRCAGGGCGLTLGGPDEAQGQRGTGGNGLAGGPLQARRQRARVDHRVPPLIQGDRFGKQLGAGAVARAVDRVDQEFHCGLGGSHDEGTPFFFAVSSRLHWSSTIKKKKVLR